LMADSLRVNGLIPLSEPFSAMGFTQAGGGGGEVMPASMLTTTGNNAIVDWVLVELRNASVPATIVATQSALITRSGECHFRQRESCAIERAEWKLLHRPSA